MIDLQKAKLVLFDFDDTLCIHKIHGSDYEEAYMLAMLRGENYWSKLGSVPNNTMIDFLHLCRNKGKVIGLISWTHCYKDMQMKEQWVKRMYGVSSIENYCVGSREGKLKLMQYLCKAFSYKPDQILLVDDFYKTINEAGDLGFQSCTPMEVVIYMEDMKREENLK